MEKNRLEAFSDGVIAIIITIMILELKIPHASEWSALSDMIPAFLTYILSFVFVAIYWNNHHHLLAATKRVTGSILWANIHLLFWLSLVPFATGWMGENHYAAIPTALYAAILLLSGVAYFILQQIIIRSQGPDSIVAKAVGRDFKGKASPMLYSAALLASFYLPVISDILFVVVALMWLIPDRRIERAIASKPA